MAGFLWYFIIFLAVIDSASVLDNPTDLFIPTALGTLNDIGQQCVDDSRHYLEALLNKTGWAQSMYGSTGKLPEALERERSGNTFYDWGLFDRCLDTQADGRQFSGQYCTVFLKVEPISSSFGLCVPSSCSSLDLQSAVAHTMGRHPVAYNMSIVTITDENHCQTRQVSALEGPAIAMIVALGLLMVLLISGTIADHLSRSTSRSLPSRFLRCFSPIQNLKTLLSTKRSSEENNIPCLHGIRVVTTAWIVMIHLGQDSFRRHTYNSDVIKKTGSLWYLQFMANGSVAVDTFLLMSGLLVACSLLRDLDRNKGRFCLPLFYFHRCMRLTPVYAIILGFAAALWFRLGSGPDWSYIKVVSEDCRAKWWQHLLYINNYKIGSPSMNCIPETWYLACEMQMFWFSPLIIYPLWKWRRAGKAWAALNMAVFIGVNVAVHILWDLPPGVMSSRPSMMTHVVDYLTSYYMQTYLRFPPYLLGILLGYGLHRIKGQSNRTLTKSVMGFGWTLAAATSGTVLYGLVPYLDERTVPVISRWYAVTYGALNRLAWAGAVAWLIFACVHGYGGWVNRLLSWKVFVPMGRLTYVVYLTHYNVIKTINSFARKPMYYSFLQQLVTYCGILVLSFGIAVLITISVEIPFLKLEKVLFNPSSSQSEQSNKSIKI